MADDDEMDGHDGPVDASRRLLLGGLVGAGVAAGTTGARAAAAASPAARRRPARAPTDRDLSAHIDTVVVIYAENRSFNNLFADFPGLERPLAKEPAEASRQRDRDGRPFDHLPPIWGGLTPQAHVAGHRSYDITQGDLPAFANAPFALLTPDGDPLPLGLVTRDLVHSFYENQLQINGGRNDGFVAWGDSGALVMGHYGDTAAELRLYSLAREFTLCDNFFMGMFGGSFANHQYLIAARPCFYPDANISIARDLIAEVEGDDPAGIRLKTRPGSPASAMEGPPRFVNSALSPDFWAVNTMLPPYAPTYMPDPDRPDYANPAAPQTMPPQHHATIGDMLSERNVDWAWYAGGWDAAAGAGRVQGQGQAFPAYPNFQPHHQPFNYFARFAPGTADRARYLREGGEGETPRTNRFMADIAAGRLPPVSFYKPQGNLNMHAGYSDVDAGDRHIARIVDALRKGPQWERMLVVITFDENGGWWDHVAPPKGDRWGPGTRIPALIVSPFARHGEVDHSIYDTGSIARFLTRRFGLRRLPGLIEREKAMVAAGGVAPGDLTGALRFD